jgi:hypothetical protein
MVANALLTKKRSSAAVIVCFLLLPALCFIGYRLGLPSLVSVLLFAAAVLFLFDRTLIAKAFTVIVILTANCFASFLIAPLAENIFGYRTDGYFLLISLFLILIYVSIATVSLRSDDLRNIITLYFEITENGLIIYLIGVMVARLSLKAIATDGIVSVMPVTAVSASSVGHLFYFGAICIVFWAFAAPFFSLKLSYENFKYKNDAEISARIIKNERAYFEKISTGYENMRRYRHDIKYSMSVIKGLAQSGKGEAILEYIGEIEEPEMPPRFCDNVAVNALIDDYQKRFLKIGAVFDVGASLDEDTKMSSYELCTLLGNILENAYEALEKCERREVSLKIRKDKKMLIIRCANSFSGEIKKSGTKIVSAKVNGGGRGLRSIEMIAAKYGGNVSVAYNEKDFTVSILIPI